jgi:hypothetical protein
VAARSLKPDRVFWFVFGAFLILAFALLYKSHAEHYSWYQENVWLVMALIHDWTVPALIIIALISVIPTFLVMTMLKAFIGIAVLLLERWKLHGVLLSVGTLLFLTARGVSVLESVKG